MKPLLISLVVAAGTVIGLSLVLVPYAGLDALRAIVVISLLNGLVAALLTVDIAWAYELIQRPLRRR